MSFVSIFFLIVVTFGLGELWLLFAAADVIGFWGTLGLCILTGIVGGSLVRAQGFQARQQIQNEMQQGKIPAVEIASGIGLLLVGVMLMTPGFITDSIGFLLLIPPLRRIAAGSLIGVVGKRHKPIVMGDFPFNQPPPRHGRPSQGHQRPSRDNVIDVEAEIEPRQSVDAPRNSAPPKKR